MTTTEISVKMVLDRWNGSISILNKRLSEITDEELQKEISPGKNRGIYLLGHLIAVHDDMQVLLGMGEKLFPELTEPFIKQADKVATQIPSVAELRAMLTKQNEVMEEKFAKTSNEDWFHRHTAVSEEDFVKEPHRNKLNIIITRTSHLQYHLGQIVLVKN
jgi:hypothetical protein